MIEETVIDSREREYYSIAETAAQLGVSRGSVSRWIRDDRLPATHLGHRTIRIARRDLERFLDGRRHGDVVSAPPSSHHDSSVLDDDGHVVQFFESDAALIDVVSTFIGDALTHGDVGIVIVTAAHREGITARLQERGSLSPSVVGEGRFVVLDADETLATLMVDGAVDAERVDAVLGQLLAWATGTGHRVRVFGEMVALLAADGNPTSTIALEECWNALQQTYAFTLLCGYPLPQLSAESQVTLFQDICAVHAHVFPAESYHGLASEGDRLRTVAVLQQKAHRLETEIVARRRAEEQLRQALQEAESALRLREEFLSIAAHELRNPLTALSLHAQLAQHRLAREGESETLRTRQTLAAIAGQAERLSALVDRLLDVSCLTRGQLGLRRQQVDLLTLVENVIAQMALASRDHQISVTAAACPRAEVDPVRVEQVLLNLLDNAIKFSPPETAIEIELAAVDPGVAELSMRDHGRGIPVEARERIFERYYQVPDSGAVQGFGLGLWVSRQIVELHGGQVRAEFPTDGGTRMVVSLPIVASLPS